MTKICTSIRPDEKVAVRLSPPDSTRIRSSRSLRGDEVVDGVEVGGDVVADRGVRTSAGLHRGDPLVGQHGVTAQEVGVLGGVDVVGQHGQRQPVAQLPAQRGDERRLAGADRTADADAQRLPRLRRRLGRSAWSCGWPSSEMWWHAVAWLALSGDEQRSLALACAAERARRAADRTGRPAPCRPRRPSASHSGESSNVSAATSPGSSASSRCAAVAEPVIVV